MTPRLAVLAVGVGAAAYLALAALARVPHGWAPNALWPTPWWYDLARSAAVFLPGMTVAVAAWRAQAPDLPRAAAAWAAAVAGGCSAAALAAAATGGAPLRAALGMGAVFVVGGLLGTAAVWPDWRAAWRHADAVPRARAAAAAERTGRTGPGAPAA